MRLLCIAGKRASGKDVFASIAKEMGIPVYRMSDFVYELMDKEGIDKTSYSVREFSTRLREKHGKDIVARLAWEKIEKDKPEFCVVNGLRSVEEYEFFSSKAKALLIGIDAALRVRYKRVVKRKREEDPIAWEEFLRVERIENSWGLSKLMKNAHMYIRNEGSLEEFKRKAKAILGFIYQ